MTHRWMAGWVVGIAMAVVLGGVGPASAGPPQFDPKQMSGIPRPDPAVPSGSITVRVLGSAGLSSPVLDAEVRLQVRGPDGRTETRTARTEAEGRATFEGLEPFVRGTAVAEVEIEGVVVASRPIQILPDTGSRVMLVGGTNPAAGRPGAGSSGPAGEAASGAPPPGHGNASGPVPGVAFPLRTGDPGQLTVGAFDVAARKGFAGVTITLRITLPSGESQVRTGVSDVQGKVLFEKLAPPEFPEGTEFIAEGVLDESGVLQRSEPFKMDDGVPKALVLTRGRDAAEESIAAVPELPAPRIVSTLEPGTVRLRVVDGQGDPVIGHPVTVTKRTAASADQHWEGRTDREGMATVSGIAVQQDAVFFTGVTYDNGPYVSSPFRMDGRGGVQVHQRVYETTRDRSLLRAAMRFDVDERENDNAQVLQAGEIGLAGEKAFWDPDLRIEGIPGAKGFTVLRSSDDWLEQPDDAAPYAVMRRPIPPGTVVSLAIGYFVQHHSQVEVDWPTPFRLVNTSVIIGNDFELNAEHATLDDEVQIEGRKIYLLGEQTVGSNIRFTVSGLAVRERIYKIIATVVGALLGLVVLVGLMRPTVSPRERLVRRKNELLELLEALAPTDANTRRRALAALDRVFRQLDALDRLDGKPESRPSTAKSSGPGTRRTQG